MTDRSSKEGTWPSRETRLRLKRHTALEDFPLCPSQQLRLAEGKYREKELNAQFERYPILKANEPMASGYATFHVTVGLFGRALSSQTLTLKSIIIPNGLEKATCTSTRFCLSICFVVTVK